MSTQTKTEPRRGDVVFVRRGGPAPTGVEMHAGRPALVVSNNRFNETSGFVTVVYLRRNISTNGPVHVDLGNLLDASATSVAVCEQIVSVDRSRVNKIITRVDDPHMREIDAALTYSLGMMPGVLVQRDTVSSNK